jgi:alkylated DNA repair protein (DNA oxidative demethylase)
MKAPMTSLPDFAGLRIQPGYLDRPAQAALLAALREIFAEAPLFTPRMPKSSFHGTNVELRTAWLGLR